MSCSEVRFASSSMDKLPNKTRVGVGIMKVHCTETVVRESPSGATAASAALLYTEETADNADDIESDAGGTTATVELLEKNDSPKFQRK